MLTLAGSPPPLPFFRRLHSGRQRARYAGSPRKSRRRHDNERDRVICSPLPNRKPQFTAQTNCEMSPVALGAGRGPSAASAAGTGTGTGTQSYGAGAGAGVICMHPVTSRPVSERSGRRSPGMTEGTVSARCQLGLTSYASGDLNRDWSRDWSRDWEPEREPKREPVRERETVPEQGKVPPTLPAVQACYDRPIPTRPTRRGGARRRRRRRTTSRAGPTDTIIGPVMS